MAKHIPLPGIRVSRKNRRRRGRGSPLKGYNPLLAERYAADDFPAPASRSRGKT